jgi:hypothetical protein
MPAAGTVGWAAKYLEPSRLRAGLLENARDFENGRDAGGVVHGAVVETVVIDRAADAGVVQMRGHHDVFVSQTIVSAREHRDDVRRLQEVAFHGHLGPERASEGEPGEGLVVTRERLDLLERVTAAREEFRGAATRDG